MQAGEPCWRDAAGVAHLDLPWRVVLPDGTTRTDPAQWCEDADVLAATGWTRSTLTDADVAALTPPEPEPVGWLTPGGWRIGTSTEDVSRLTATYVLAARREQLGRGVPVAITDTDGERHVLAFAEFDSLLLAYGAAMEATDGQT
jgi:hypothetical protein